MAELPGTPAAIVEDVKPINSPSVSLELRSPDAWAEDLSLLKKTLATMEGEDSDDDDDSCCNLDNSLIIDDESKLDNDEALEKLDFEYEYLSPLPEQLQTSPKPLNRYFDEFSSLQVVDNFEYINLLEEGDDDEGYMGQILREGDKEETDLKIDSDSPTDPTDTSALIGESESDLENKSTSFT